MKKRSKAQISFNMSRVRSTGSAIEKTFASALRRRGIKHGRNSRAVIGKPDFVLSKSKTAIFCDSAFWHGYRFLKTNRHNFKTNKKFWIEKISTNIKRDQLVNKTLRKQGWKVLRFWDFQIKKDVNKCITKMIKATSRK